MKKTSTWEWIIVGVVLSLIILLITPPFTLLILSWVICFCSLGNMFFTHTTFNKLNKVIFVITLLWASYLTGSTELNPLSIHIKGGQFDKGAIP